MNILSLSGLQSTGDVSSVRLSGITSEAGTADGTDFSNIFKDVLSMVENTDSADKASALELLTGEADDVASVLIDAQKADIALGLTVELRNKVVDAYKEVMNMQV